MTNLIKIYTLYNVHSHKERDVLKDLLENHLPKEYTKKVIKKLALEEIAVSSGAVRNVKYGYCKNMAVFNAIIEIAREQKEISDRLKKNLQKAG